MAWVEYVASVRRRWGFVREYKDMEVVNGEVGGRVWGGGRGRGEGVRFV